MIFLQFFEERFRQQTGSHYLPFGAANREYSLNFYKVYCHFFCRMVE